MGAVTGEIVVVVAVTFVEAVVIIAISDAVELCGKKRRGSGDDDGTKNTKNEPQTTSHQGWQRSQTQTGRKTTLNNLELVQGSRN